MLRFASSSLVALLIVGLLFSALDFAIGHGEKRTGPDAPARIEFTSLMRSKPVAAKQRVKPEPRAKPKLDPSAMALASTTTQSRANSPLELDLSSSLLADTGSSDGGSGVRAGDVSAGGGRFTGGRADRGLMPLVRVEPEYPQSASRQRLEGWVIVEFTVTTSGAVRDPRVLAAQPERIFDQSAIKSVLRWRYSPQVENGSPVERTVQMKIVFRQPTHGRS